MSALAGLLSHLRARFESEGVPFAVGGSFALAAAGFPRFTDDVDLMVLATDLAPVHRALSSSRIEKVNEVTFRDAETGLHLGVSLVEDEAQRAAFDRARATPVHGAAGVRVLTPEGLALMLLREATSGDPRKRPLRLRDVELLSAELDLEWQFVREWTRRGGYEKAYGDVVAATKPPL